MLLPRWHKVDRRRKCNISYKDPMYVKYYDLDLSDFTYLVSKLRNNERLSEAEDNRYGIYILTICLIVQEHTRFKMKPLWEREEMIDQMYYELIPGLLLFDPERGSSIYSYGYRIAYTSACHYFTNKKKQEEHKSQIDEHIQQEIDDYLYEFSDHKVNTNSNKDI